MIDICNISYGYDDRTVLKDVSLTVESGEIVGILGPNGSGKSTLLRCVNNILPPETGSISIDGTDLDCLEQKDIARTIGHVQQETDSSFEATVYETVLLGRKPYISWRPSEKDFTVVSSIIEKLGLEPLAMRAVSELSGGQKQKVAMARALAQQPDVLLLDEPTSNLDLKYQVEVLDTVRKQVTGGMAALLVVHDLNLAARYSDKILLLKDGESYALGGPDVLNQHNLESVYEVDISIFEQDEKKVILPKSTSPGI
ncbi:ABC transporter [Natrialba chahannaoensis JCM 10990]|uniref:Cobalamin import ATP-binding protein BtuD n=1 Tax=Natrialba chahannaoensis JCM 10990 TaxID=1227492 RepID=M0AC65_9EURY|nr:ABC transporter ATP-binding protein [Natrialba chahannaoensis]ELY96119.1 ABC transporter [Natrialba chahannaoensis JCM 10990]